MFRVLSIVIIIGSIIWLYSLWKNNKLSFSKVFKDYFASLKESFGKLGLLKSQNFSTKINSFKRLVYLFTLLLFLLMAISAFIPLVLFGDTLSGLFLLIHVFIAPIFSVFLAILIILFAHSHLFSKTDLIDSKDTITNRLNQKGYLKIIFWLIALFSIPAMLSIIFSMFPIFGTDGQNYLLEIHRYSTIILFVLVVFHSGLLTVYSE